MQGVGVAVGGVIENHCLNRFYLDLAPGLSLGLDLALDKMV